MGVIRFLASALVFSGCLLLHQYFKGSGPSEYLIASSVLLADFAIVVSIWYCFDYYMKKADKDISNFSIFVFYHFLVFLLIIIYNLYNKFRKGGFKYMKSLHKVFLSTIALFEITVFQFVRFILTHSSITLISALLLALCTFLCYKQYKRLAK